MIRHSAPRPQIDRRYRLRDYDVEVHREGCQCRHCNPDRLTFTTIGNLALLAVVVGSVIAFAIDPDSAARALLDVFRGWAS